MQDRISIITATYNAPEWLQRAVKSMMEQDNPNWEMIISPDDGKDYRFLEDVDPRIRVVRSTVSRTGPGAARNRGLAVATGTYVTTLDDDDTLECNFVHEVLAALKTCDLLTVPTRYVTETGAQIRTVGDGLGMMDIPLFGRQLGSMHVSGRRELHPLWKTCFAQDVVHTCEAIDRAGGAIRVLQSTAYRCTVRAQSTCAVRSDIDDEYRHLIEDRQGGMSEIGYHQTQDLFRHRRKINALFLNRVATDLGYHEFVSKIGKAD